MPRNRMIKADFWGDEKIAALSLKARLLFIGLWNFSDDHGVCRAHPVYIKSNIFPYDDLKKTAIEQLIKEICDKKFAILGNHNDEAYIFIKNFEKHQTISRPSNRLNVSNDLKDKETIKSVFIEYVMSTHGVCNESSLTKDKVKEKVKVKGRAELFAEVVGYLNECVGSDYNPKTLAIQSVVDARLNENYSVDDFKKVIDVKSEEWKNNTEMSKYLRPSTLFAKKHFEEYLQQSKVTGHTSGEDIFNMLEARLATEDDDGS